MIEFLPPFLEKKTLQTEPNTKKIAKKLVSSDSSIKRYRSSIKMKITSCTEPKRPQANSKDPKSIVSICRSPAHTYTHPTGCGNEKDKKYSDQKTMLKNGFSNATSLL